MVALSNGEVVEGLSLSLPFRKLVLGRALDPIEDLPAIDHGLYENSVRKVRDAEDVTGWGLYFTEPFLPWPGDDGAGDITGNKRKAEPELCEGGRERELTQDNKGEYLRLLPAALLRQYTDGIEAQTRAFRAGMARQCGNAHAFRRLCRLLTPADLDLLVGGMPAIDVGEWRRHCEVRHTPADAEAAGAPVVAWFWAVLEEDCTPEQRAGVLQFATGCGRVPVGGFQNLSGYHGQTNGFRLDVLPFDPANATVTAATCFNTLRIRRYASRAELRRRLLSAAANGAHGGFHEDAVA